MLEEYTIMLTYFYVISEVERLILRRRSPEPGYGCHIKTGLDICKYYDFVCKLRGLSAFSG